MKSLHAALVMQKSLIMFQGILSQFCISDLWLYLQYMNLAMQLDYWTGFISKHLHLSTFCGLSLGIA